MPVAAGNDATTPVGSARPSQPSRSRAACAWSPDRRKYDGASNGWSGVVVCPAGGKNSTFEPIQSATDVSPARTIHTDWSPPALPVGTGRSATPNSRAS